MPVFAASAQLLGRTTYRCGLNERWMLPLRPDARFDLEHRAFHLAGRAAGSLFVAASSDGHYSLLDCKSGIAWPQCPSAALSGISLHPTKPILARVGGKSGDLVAQAFHGNVAAQIQPPAVSGGSRLIRQGFHDCFFEESGEFLWLAGPLADDRGELLLVETTGWSVARRAVVPDRFGASSWSLHRTGTPGLLSLCIAAGQDGQEVYWVRRQGNRFAVERADALGNCTPPVFSPDGREFLVLDESRAICRYDFTEMKQLGPHLSSGDDDNPFAESLCYFHDRTALAGSGEGRIFLVDLERMTVADEVAVEGHDPKPIGEYFPNLARERGVATDISWFTRLGDVVVFVYPRDRQLATRDWKDVLMCRLLGSPA